METRPETDEARFTAYALGELDESERPEVYSQLAQDAEGRRMVSEVRELATRLAQAFRDEPPPTAALTPAQRQAILDKLADQGPESRPRILPFPGARLLAPALVAAALLATIGLSLHFRGAASNGDANQLAQTAPIPRGAAEPLQDEPSGWQDAPKSLAPASSPSMPPPAAPDAAPLIAEAKESLDSRSGRLNEVRGFQPAPAVASADLPPVASADFMEAEDAPRTGIAMKSRARAMTAAPGSPPAATKPHDPTLAKMPTLAEASPRAAIVAFRDPTAEQADRMGLLARGGASRSPARDGAGNAAALSADASSSNAGNNPITMRGMDSKSQQAQKAGSPAKDAAREQETDLASSDRSFGANVGNRPDTSDARSLYGIVRAEQADTSRLPLALAARENFFGYSRNLFDINDIDTDAIARDSIPLDPMSIQDDPARKTSEIGKARSDNAKEEAEEKLRDEGEDKTLRMKKVETRADEKASKDQEVAEGPLTLTVDMAACPWDARSRLGRVVLTARPPAAGEDEQTVVAHNVRLDVTFPADRTDSYRWVLPAVPTLVTESEPAPQGPRAPEAGENGQDKQPEAGVTLTAGRQVIGLVEITPKPNAPPAAIRAVARYTRGQEAKAPRALAQSAEDTGRTFDQADASFRFATALGAFGLASQERRAEGGGSLPTREQALGWAKMSEDGELFRRSIVQSMERQLRPESGPSTVDPGLAAPAAAPPSPAAPRP